MKNFSKHLILTSSLFLMSCSSLGFSSEDDGSEQAFLNSGSIVLSQRLPSKRIDIAAASNAKSLSEEQPMMAPLVGYVPNVDKFFPAINENWIEIDRKTKTLSLFRGEEKLEEISSQGAIELEAGTYSLLHKEQDPLWYAPDQYFKTRGMELPGSDDLGRYRRGAYGDYALFLGNSLAIHSSLVWSDEVGGIRLQESEAKKLFAALDLGAQVIVR